MKSYSPFVAAVFFILLTTSCKKFVSIPPPPNQLVKTSVFTSDQSATAAVSGLYSDLMNTGGIGFNAMLPVIAGLYADELSYGSNDPSFVEFQTNSLNATNTNILSVWTTCYKYIYNANAILEGLEGSKGISDTTKNRLTGECKFVRAFCNFYLVNLWGNAPLINTTDYLINQGIGRNTTDEVYQQIKADLIDAQKLLGNFYFAAERARPNGSTATALLARVYLYLGDYAQAEAQSTLVINNSAYVLTTTANVFLKGSPETIWQLVPVNPGFNTPIGNQFIPNSSTVIPTYPLSAALVNAFENNDMRKINWTKTNIVSAQNYYYPFKYKIKTGGAPLNEYYIVFRLAEQYLIRAEARIQQTNISGSQSDLNMIRVRAGLSNTIANDKPSLLSAIARERQVELFTEWGDRFLNLKRTGSADAVLAAAKGSSWQATDLFWPIPKSQIDANSNLTQNAGY
jgi:hypothetical protein